MNASLPPHKYDEERGIVYRLIGRHYFPAVLLEQEMERWEHAAMARSKLLYMAEFQPALLYELSADGRLDAYLSAFIREKQEKLNLLSKQMGGDAMAEARAREMIFYDDMD